MNAYHIQLGISVRITVNSSQSISLKNMSTAFYSSVTPKLLASFSNALSQRIVEVWITTCIVTNFGQNNPFTSRSVLINPANPELSGCSRFTYFPKGGPVPKMKPQSMHRDWQPLGYVSSWGGMEVGSGMMYPVSVIDGLVHQLGGSSLALECKYLQTFQGGCPTGEAVVTSRANDSLKKAYSHIVHTAPPFYQDENSREKLHSCYRNALSLAFQMNGVRKVACPLIGAGCRGFSVEDAIDIASTEVLSWRNKDSNHNNHSHIQTVAFGIPDAKIADSLVHTIKSKIKE